MRLAGGTLSYKDQELTLHRHGRPEQVWMNFDYSPVFDESGKPAGVLAIVVETTERVAAERRHAFRLAIEERLRGLNEPTDMMEEATALLGRHLGVAQVGFAEVEDDQEHIVVARDWNDGHIPSVVGRWRMDDFGPQFIRALKAGQTIPIRDVALDPRTRAPEAAAAYDGINTRAILDVPLVRDGHMVALLLIHDPEARAWAPEEGALVEESCGRLWSAVERARAEAALRTSERRLRRAHAAARLGDFTWDVATARPRCRASTRACSASRPPRCRPPRPAFFELIHPDDRERVQAEAAPMLAGDPKRFDTEYRLVRGDREGEGRLSDGRAARVVGVNYDVTARRRAEEALRESEARFRLMADAVPQIVWVTDAEGRVDFFNKQWFDYTGAELNPTSAAEVSDDHVYPDDAGLTMATFDDARRTGGVFQIEHRIRSRTGEYRWSLVRGEPYRDPGTGGITK